MNFNSLAYLVFFPAIVILYFILPGRKMRNALLLVASYGFYMCWNPKYIILMFLCTLITYLDGIFIGIAKKEEQEKVAKNKRRTGRPRAYIVTTVLFMLGVLAYFKYGNFLLDSMVRLFALFGVHLRIPSYDVVLPVGVSFFTFQAVSYDLDVYRGDVEVEKNFFRFALFVSFFPQLVAGPIERSGHLLHQFDEKHAFDAERITRGVMTMLWGYFMKIVIADRAAVFVDQVYNYWPAYNGLVLILATVLFAVQIYCDFGGYSFIAIGSAQVLGFDLMQNFRQPYFAVSVADFWRRWHISLTTWFRDYLYFPLGGSRTTKWKHWRNIMIVFLVSGLWHGASWTYVIWGGLNGLLQIIGMWLKPFREKGKKALRIAENSFGLRLFQSIVTFILVDFTWIFFRASTVRNAFGIIRNSFTCWNPWVLFDGTLYTLGLSQVEFHVLLFAIGVLFIVDLLHYNGISIRNGILRQPLPVRWTVYILGSLFVLIYGMYGPAYHAASFIYFQF